SKAPKDFGRSSALGFVIGGSLNIRLNRQGNACLGGPQDNLERPQKYSTLARSRASRRPAIVRNRLLCSHVLPAWLPRPSSSGVCDSRTHFKRVTEPVSAQSAARTTRILPIAAKSSRPSETRRSTG